MTALLVNTPAQAETLLNSLKQAAAGIGLHVNAHKTEYMCFNQRGDISTLNGSSLKLVDEFIYLGSSVSSTKTDINMRLAKPWTAIDRLSVIWKLDLTDKMKCSFFPSDGRVDTAIWMQYMDTNKMYGEKTWPQLHKNAESNIEQVQETTPHKTVTIRPRTTHHKTIKVRWTRHAEHCWRSRDELISDILLWTSSHGRAKAGRPALCRLGCSIEDLPEAMDGREEWRKRIREIRAGGATWWWWWWWWWWKRRLCNLYTEWNRSDF